MRVDNVEFIPQGRIALATVEAPKEHKLAAKVTMDFLLKKLALITILVGTATIIAPGTQAQSWTVWNGIAAANEAAGTNAGTNPVPSRRAWQHLVYDSGVGKVVWDAGQLNCCAGTLNAGLSFFDDSAVAGPGSASAWSLGWANMVLSNEWVAPVISGCDRGITSGVPNVVTCTLIQPTEQTQTLINWQQQLQDLTPCVNGTSGYPPASCNGTVTPMNIAVYGVTGTCSTGPCNTNFAYQGLLCIPPTAGCVYPYNHLTAPFLITYVQAGPNESMLPGTTTGTCGTSPTDPHSCFGGPAESPTVMTPRHPTMQWTYDNTNNRIWIPGGVAQGTLNGGLGNSPFCGDCYASSTYYFSATGTANYMQATEACGPDVACSGNNLFNTRIWGSAVWDDVNDQLIVMQGLTKGGSGTPNDTLEFNPATKTWTEQTASFSSGPRWRAEAKWVHAQRAVYFFYGVLSGATTTPTSEIWKGVASPAHVSWTKLTVLGPAPNAAMDPVLDYDPNRGTVGTFIYITRDTPAQVWEFDPNVFASSASGTPWTQLCGPSIPCPAVLANAAPTSTPQLQLNAISCLPTGGSCDDMGAFNATTNTFDVIENVTGSNSTTNIFELYVPPSNMPVAATPTNLVFASQAEGTTSATETATFENLQTSPLTISSIGISGGNAPGDFAVTSTCPITPNALGPGQSCSIFVSFTPLAVGNRTASLTFGDSATTSPQSIALTGTGTVPFTVSPTSLSFSATAVGSTTTQTATLKNVQAVPMTVIMVVSGGDASADYIVGGTCPKSPSKLGVGQSCSITVMFKPSNLGSRTATLNVTDGASAGSQSIALSGTAVSPVAVSPLNFTFANTAVGVTTAAQTSTLTNVLATPLTISSIATSLGNAPGDYGSSSTCPMSPNTLGAGQSCSISITFSPSALGARASTLKVSFNAFGSPQSIALSGTGIAPVSVAPTNMAFGSVLVGTSAPLTLTLTNHLNFGLPWSSAVASGDFGVSSNTCAPTVGAGLSCTILVALTPTALGSRTGTLTINYGAFGSPTLVALSGSGNDSGLTSITVSPTTPSIAQGNTQQFAATGHFKSSTANLTSLVTWSSNKTSVATIVAGGLAKGLATGSSTISAILSGVTGSTMLTVTAPSLVSIAVTPANSSIAAGNKEQFTATGTYNNGTTQNVTNTAAWSSSTSGVATITASGLATGVTTGTSSISATFSGITGSAPLTVTAPVLVSIAVTPANSSIAAGNSQQFVATGTYSNGTSANLTNASAWSSSVPGVATIAANGLATSATMGSSSIIATLNGVTGSTTLTVTAPALVSIAVAPPNLSIPAGSSQQFTATGTYSDGSNEDLTNTATWSSTAPNVATISGVSGSQGLATAAGAGTSTIGATSGSVSGSTILTVTSPILIEQVNATSGILVQENSDPLQVSGLAQKVVIENPIIVTAVSVQFQNSSSQNGYAYIDLVSDDGTGKPSNQLSGILGTSTNLDNGVPNGSFTFVMPAVAVPAGTFYVVVRTQNVSANGTSACLIVTGQTAAPATMTPVEIQNPATQNWSVATPRQFLAFSLTALTTASPALSSVTITPAAPAISLGSTQQLAALGVYADGTMQDLTSSATWNSSNLSVATENVSGLLSGITAGTSSISASLGTTSGSTTATATVGSPLTVQQTNSDTSNLIQQGSTPPLMNGISQPLTLTAPIIVNSVSLQLSNVSYNEGYAYVDIVKDDGTGKPSNNSTDIIATSITQVWELQSGTYTFNFSPIAVPGGVFHIVLRTQNVTAGSGSSLTITTGSTSSLPGLNGILTQDPSTQIWSAASPIQYLTFTLSALTTAGAVFDGLTSLAVAPASASISVGQTQQFSATGTYADGSTTDLSSSAAWNSSSTSAATVGTTGVATAVAAGTTNITASLYGIASNSATLTVGPATLVSITVTPTNGATPAGLSLQFDAVGTYSDGSMLDVTSSVGWSSGSPVAMINSAGLATGVIVGMTTITATSGTVQGAATITVTSPVLASISVTPMNPSIAAGNVQQFIATGTYSDGSTQNLTGTVTWSSLAQGVATITAGGLATGVAPGSSNISATISGMTGSTTLTVTAPVLVSIAVTPVNGSIPLSGTQQFTATGTYSDGSTQNLTSTATWNSSAGNLATISAAGLASAVGLGQSTIQATLAAINGSTTLTVTPGFALTGSLNTARYRHTATLLNDGTVLIAGGENFPGSSLSSAELYSPTTATFSPTNGALSYPRYDHTATLLSDGTVLIVGGRDSSGNSISSAELYDPTNGTFTVTTGGLNNARYNHTATLLDDGTVLIAGGESSSGNALSTAEIYNPSTGAFGPVANNLNVARYKHGATPLSDGTVLIAGGESSPSNSLNSAELYNPTAGTFSFTSGTLINARYDHTSTLLSDGTVLLAGGENSPSNALASAELYTLSPETFSTSGTLNNARYDHTATPLGGGTVLLAGGYYASGYLASAELYDPVAQGFALTGSLNTARSQHTATVLNNGTVLIVGGFNGSALAGAELYYSQ